MILQDQYVEGLNAVDWDEERKQELELFLHNSTQTTRCGGPGGGAEVILIYTIAYTGSSTLETQAIYSHLSCVFS